MEGKSWGNIWKSKNKRKIIDYQPRKTNMPLKQLPEKMEEAIMQEESAEEHKSLDWKGPLDPTTSRPGCGLDREPRTSANFCPNSLTRLFFLFNWNMVDTHYRIGFKHTKVISQFDTL